MTAESRADRVIGEAIAIDPLLDNAPCGFASLGDDGTLYAVNTTLLGMLGYEREELLGRHFETILTVGAKIFFQTHFFPLLRMHGRADEIFFLLRAKNGDDIAVIVNAVRRERGGRWISDCVVIHVRERSRELLNEGNLRIDILEHVRWQRRLPSLRQAVLHVRARRSECVFVRNDHRAL